MKTLHSAKYPNSSTLFRFCKEALKLNYQTRIKIIDQDVGAILDFDPADCSHWKRGNKNINSLVSLKVIADHFKIDQRIPMAIVSGDMSLEQALFEFQGYGKYFLNENDYQYYRTQYFANPEKWSSKKNRSFDQIFAIKKNIVENAAYEILAGTEFKSAPIPISGVIDNFRNIQLKYFRKLQDPIEIEYSGASRALKATFYYNKYLSCHYIRFLLARELFNFLLKSRNKVLVNLFDTPEEIIDIHANLFAAYLLLPDQLIKKEIASLDSSSDVISKLSKKFQVSSALMNIRLWHLN